MAVKTSTAQQQINQEIEKLQFALKLRGEIDAYLEERKQKQKDFDADAQSDFETWLAETLFPEE